ncbi:hypothetical protein [Edaphobacter albus]|uniref:hypothetical protein n=1 Tax=Edaphobacter sp. 4G125 TaxID=2763071 RepID=UPI00164938BE|nr:hypothetical protein [Edaphobacter sp. 4G125]QNI36191.1 hypothetical protein H7846_14555 [Edaphobacter sp. 4G125]
MFFADTGISVAERSENLNYSSASALWASRALVILALLVQIFVAWRFWAITWDDSAITLGFARTFAHTGRIEPTPGSGIVEGYSTTLWMLLMAAAAKVIVSPAALLAFAKISTLVLNLINIVLIRRWFLTWTPEVLANLVAGIVGCTLMFYETINGMETPLILALVLVMLLLFPSIPGTRRFWYIVAGCLLLLLRWEAAWLLVPFVLAERSFRRAVLPASCWTLLFLISNLARWLYFGDLLPNTILAKRHFPYSAPSLRIAVTNRLLEPVSILYDAKVLLALLAAYVVYSVFVAKVPIFSFDRLKQAFRESWQLRFTVLFLLFCFVLSTAIGPNWGPEFRSFYPAWPFLIGLLLLPVLPNLTPKVMGWVTVALCLFTVLRMEARIQPLRSEKAPIYMPKITVAHVGTAVPILTELQRVSGQMTLTYAAPDMGAVMLYSKNVRVIDLGLLCDRVLAHKGFAAVRPYVLQQRQPDVIEVHEIFTQTTKLGSYPEFIEQYRPVYIQGIRFFVNRRLLSKLPVSRLVEREFLPDGSPQSAEIEAFRRSNAPYPYISLDNTLNQSFHTYLVLQ